LARIRITRLVFPLVLLGATALVVLLALQLRGARAENAQLAERARFFQAGTYVPEIRTQSLTGESVGIVGARGPLPHLLFDFSTRCPHCEASVPAWRLLATRAASSVPGSAASWLSLPYISHRR
jgi:hypothetical protein